MIPILSALSAEVVYHSATALSGTCERFALKVIAPTNKVHPSRILQVEGEVNRLKLLKRQMYGRGSLDLLKARVLHRAGV